MGVREVRCVKMYVREGREGVGGCMFGLVWCGRMCVKMYVRAWEDVC